MVFPCSYPGCMTRTKLCRYSDNQNILECQPRLTMTINVLFPGVLLYVHILISLLLASLQLYYNENVCLIVLYMLFKFVL